MAGRRAQPRQPKGRSTPPAAHFKGRALNLGMAAISSSSTTSRGLKRGGRVRFLVFSLGDCAAAGAAGRAGAESVRPAFDTAAREAGLAC